MLIQRSLFAVAKMLLWLVALVAGGWGGLLMSRAVFGGTEDSLIHFVGTLLAVVAATSFSTLGVHFGVVLPLHFCFPNARRMFGWESRDPSYLFRLYRWYGRNLEAYGEGRLRGET